MCLRIDEKLSLGTFSVVYCAPLVLSFKQANYVRYKDHLLCSEHPVRPSYTRLGNEVNMKSDRCWVLCATYVYVYVCTCMYWINIDHQHLEYIAGGSGIDTLRSTYANLSSTREIQSSWFLDP